MFVSDITFINVQGYKDRPVPLLPLIFILYSIFCVCVCGGGGGGGGKRIYVGGEGHRESTHQKIQDPSMHGSKDRWKDGEAKCNLHDSKL